MGDVFVVYILGVFGIEEFMLFIIILFVLSDLIFVIGFFILVMENGMIVFLFLKLFDVCGMMIGEVKEFFFWYYMG